MGSLYSMGGDMKVQEYRARMVKGSLVAAPTVVFYLNGKGEAVCKGEKDRVDSFNRNKPEIYKNNDIEHKNPISPKEGEKYLEALLNDNRSSYTYYKAIK